MLWADDLVDQLQLTVEFSLTNKNTEIVNVPSNFAPRRLILAASTADLRRGNYLADLAWSTFEPATSNPPTIDLYRLGNEPMFFTRRFAVLVPKTANLRKVEINPRIVVELGLPEGDIRTVQPSSPYLVEIRTQDAELTVTAKQEGVECSTVK
jgi:hypothetical protein